MYRFSLFEKLIICRGLKFCLPPNVSPIDILARFEKAYWRIEPLLEENVKHVCSTLRSIAVNCIQRSSPNPPKVFVNTPNSFKKRDDIVITKTDKGSKSFDGQN